MIAIRHHLTEDDGFNQLVQIGLNWREITLLRAMVRYRMQSGLDGVLETQIHALRDNPFVTKALVNLFLVKFAPSSDDPQIRLTQVKMLLNDIEKRLQSVVSLEHDKVLRRLMSLIDNIHRTNFFQLDSNGSQKSHISFKIASQALKDLPEPKPYREIFVWAPHVEGVHLRFGPVARGGLRWSDRRDDFRTEVLGLVKAQQVKNAVIVPVGSKGGFYPKQLPKKGTPDEVRAVAIYAYKTFLSGLLDLTDNIDTHNKVIAPPSVVCWDGPDPYLVVAADKGTATFSDIANNVANTYGFWLGDAFASGGSKGYDHKVMGITAKGAWEAVKRHFREKGKNIQEEVFTVAGGGDMSGDVFGNGMLLSPKIKLVAAFDHRDIFLDPNPDIVNSFAERQRLFGLSRSSWADYRSEIISKGGGVYSRSQKSVLVSPEMSDLLGIEPGEITPNDLLKAILKSPVELLYFGGIGTYIKAAQQTHADVGDKANDAIRVDATEIRAEVIGEGANLGLTQIGRIALSAQGVRLNTDAIDNSAGVDCSDHEVNIKILLGGLIARGQLKEKDRDDLLVAMTDDVSRLVLKDNYNQSLALSLAEENALDDVVSVQSFMGALEARGKLDRKVEDLPSNIILDQRRAVGKGLLRPELAVVMSYSKLVLFDDIMASRAVIDPGLIPHLIHYFPHALHKYDEAIRTHRLSREIIATVLSNDIVNMAGPTFIKRVLDSTDADLSTVVLCFEATRRMFGIDALWAEINARDNQMSASIQHDLYNKLSRFLRKQTYWMARRYTGQSVALSEMLKPYENNITQFINQGEKALTHMAKARLQVQVETMVSKGAPRALSEHIALLSTLHHLHDVIDLSHQYSKDLLKTDVLHSLAGERFGFDLLAKSAAELSSSDPWDRMAARRLIEDVRLEQKTVVRAMMRTMQPNEEPHIIIQNWEKAHAQKLEPLNRLIETFFEAQSMAGTGLSFAKLTILNARLREWVSQFA
jgi:glutamate dehydrogenase